MHLTQRKGRRDTNHSKLQITVLFNVWMLKVKQTKGQRYIRSQVLFLVIFKHALSVLTFAFFFLTSIHHFICHPLFSCSKQEKKRTDGDHRQRVRSRPAYVKNRRDTMETEAPKAREGWFTEQTLSIHTGLHENTDFILVWGWRRGKQGVILISVLFWNAAANKICWWGDISFQGLNV